MERRSSGAWPLGAAVAGLWACVLVVALASLAMNGARLIYPVDDTYIHMAIARNVAQHRVWGVSPYGFSWCTSSPLWTGLLALVYSVFGVGDHAPLVLNLLFATGFCAIAFLLLRRRALDEVQTFVAIALLIVMTPLPSLVMLGMEHVLHLIAVCAFIYLAADTLAGAKDWPDVALIALAPIVTTARYEGLFLIAPVVLLFALRRRFAMAAAILAAAMLPIVILGVWAMAHGWDFFPNSLLLKANLPGSGVVFAMLAHSIAGVAENLIGAPALIVMGIIAAVALSRELSAKRTLWSFPALALSLYIAMLTAHIAFARTGMRWYSRYDAYLVGSGIFVFACCWRERCFEPLAGLFTAPRLPLVLRAAKVVALVAVIVRAASSLVFIPEGTNLVYRQQYQIARFVNRFYPGETLVLNDIGVVGYLCDVRIVDLAGLASMPVAQAIRTHRFDATTVHNLSQNEGVQVAIVYPELFSSRPPKDWVEVGQWLVPGYAALGFRFYAVGKANVGALRKNLSAFNPSLPEPMTATLMPHAFVRKKEHRFGSSQSLG